MTAGNYAARRRQTPPAILNSRITAARPCPSRVNQSFLIAACTAACMRSFDVDESRCRPVCTGHVPPDWANFSVRSMIATCRRILRQVPQAKRCTRSHKRSPKDSVAIVCFAESSSECLQDNIFVTAGLRPILPPCRGPSADQIPYPAGTRAAASGRGAATPIGSSA